MTNGFRQLTIGLLAAGSTLFASPLSAGQATPLDKTLSCDMATSPAPYLLAQGKSEIVSPDESEAAMPKALVDENPYKNGRGLRIAGYVLLGMGLFDFAGGLALDANHVFADMYAESGQRQTGVVFDKLCWIEGLVESVIALPMVIAGYAQLGRWNSWEREHNKKGLNVRFQGSRMVMEF